MISDALQIILILYVAPCNQRLKLHACCNYYLSSTDNYLTIQQNVMYAFFIPGEIVSLKGGWMINSFGKRLLTKYLRNWVSSTMFCWWEKHWWSPPDSTNFRLALVRFISYSPTFIHGIVTRIERQWVFKEKHFSLTCWFVAIAPESNILAETLVLFSHNENEFIHRQDVFCHKIVVLADRDDTDL